MNKLLVFLMLCIASASCVHLENLCSTDHFDHDGVLVNAFYKSSMNMTFPGLNHYLISSSVTCDRSEFVNKTNFFEAIKIKNNFNRKFAEFYTNDLNDATGADLTNKRSRLMQDWKALYEIKKVEPTSKCVQTFEGKIKSAYFLFQDLSWLVNYNTFSIGDETGSKPSKSEAIEILDELFGMLNNDGDGQTFALKGKTASDAFLHLGLVLRGGFKFLTDGPVQPNTEAMLTIEHYLPFNNDRHTDEGCVWGKDLPLFYPN